MMAKRKGRLSAEAYAEGILNHNRVLLSRAITVSESTLSSDRALTNDILRLVLPHTGKSLRIGITGIPGVGKSTFIDAFGTYLTERPHNVAVLAIDPSSALSRGSILGDKTRMHSLARNPKAYIRPSPTAGSLGGVSRRTREAMLLCEAAGFEIILIETVGVGQSEIAVRHMVDAFVLLAIPHAGDELQGIKRGIMEMADLIFMNKSEDALLPLARQSKVQLSQALRLFPPKDSGWKTEVLIGSALQKIGIDNLWEKLQELETTYKNNGFWEENRRRQALIWMMDHIRHELEHRFMSHKKVISQFPIKEAAVLAQQMSPIQAAEELLSLWQSSEEAH